MESLNVKNINDEKIFNVIDPNGQGEVVNRIRPISISINQKAETINDQTDSTINLAVYWNDTWKSILDLTFDESLRQEYGKLTQDLTNIQKDIDMKQYKDAETKTADFLKYVANLSSKYTAIPEKAVVSKTKNDFVKVIADKNSVKATISDKLLNFMLKKYAKVDTLDYTKSNECFSTSKFNCLANNYDIYYHSPEIFQKQAYMTVVKDNKVVGSYKVNYDQFSKFASKFMLTPQKLGYSKDRLAGYMKTAEVVMQNIFFDSVDEAKEWQEMVDEKKKEQATTPEGEEETTETTTTETKTEMGEGKSESPIKGDGGLARPSEDFASDEIPESEPRQQEQQGGGQNLGASRRVNLFKKKASYTDKEISNIGYEQGSKDGTKAKGIKETKEIIDKNLNQLKEKYGKDKNGMGSFILKEWNSFVTGYTNGFSDGLTGNVEKKAKVGYNAEPENELEEKAVKIGDEIMNVEWDFGEEIQNLEDILEENPKNKKVIEERISVLKGKRIEAIKKVVEKYNKEFANKEIADLVYEHLQDHNAHKANSIVLSIVNGKQASKKVKLNKKALYGDVQEQDIVPAKTETKVYLQSEDKKKEYWEDKFFHEGYKKGKETAKNSIEKYDLDNAKNKEQKEIDGKNLDKEQTENYLFGFITGYNEIFREKNLNNKSSKKTNVKKQAEETIEEKIEEQVADDTVKGKIGVGDIVAINFDNVISSEDFPKYEEFIGKPLILMENDKEDITKVIVEQTEYPFQRITVDNKDVVMYEEVKNEDVIVEDTDGDEMITTFEELPIVAKQCKIKSIHKAANITRKKANLTKKAINSLEDVAGLIDDILSDYDWYDYADQLEVGEKSHYENILADLQKDEKGTIEALFNRVSENDEEYSSPKIEQLKEYYNNKFSNGGK